MAKKLAASQKKELAKMYYLNGITVQKHLAEKVGVTEKTMGRWVRDGKWEELALNIPAVKQEQLQKLLRELQALNEAIELKPEGRRYADNKEADIRRKLVADIESLEGDASVSDIVSVAMSFTKWMAKVFPDKSREIGGLFDLFIKERLQ